jgi:hypothetical protein
MFNISGFGLTISLIASNTFPVGVILTNFPDDTDAVDFPTIEIADGEVGVNGDLVVWSKGAKIPCTISAIPDSPTDIQLALLLAANRIGRGKISARDTFQMALVQGNDNLFTLTGGIIVSGMPSNSVANSGRMKSKPYNFIFENVFGA